MDKIEKFLKKLSIKEREWILFCMLQIQKGNLDGLDVKKMKGETDLFRVRKGNIRIIYKKGDRGYSIVNIDFRGNIY